LPVLAAAFAAQLARILGATTPEPTHDPVDV
jgi:hypothetical protein